METSPELGYLASHVGWIGTDMQTFKVAKWDFDDYRPDGLFPRLSATFDDEQAARQDGAGTAAPHSADAWSPAAGPASLTTADQSESARFAGLTD
jgi:hypothetical protein